MTTTTLLSKQNAADAFGVSQRTIDRLRECGAIDSIRVQGQVRITVVSLERYIQNQLAAPVELTVADDYPIAALDALRAKKAA